MPAIPSLDEKPEKPIEADASYTALSANQGDGTLECSSQTIDDLNSRISIQPSSLPETRLRSPVHVSGEGTSQGKDGTAPNETLDPAGCPPSSDPKDAPRGVAKDGAARIDNWTPRTGWPARKTQKLLISILNDYLPSCLLCSGPFMRDFEAGSTRYCSPALVNALLCLSTRVDGGDRTEPAPPSQGLAQRPTAGTSTAFFDEAQSSLSEKGSLDKLPNIQALGILSLYKLVCGHESQARALAESFADAMTDLCLREAARPVEEQYRVVRATSYCASISLIRLLELTSLPTERLRTEQTTDNDSIMLDLPACNLAPALAISSQGHMFGQPYSWQINRIKVFQLTEWVYKFITSIKVPGQSRGPVSGSDVMALYRNCADWYAAFLEPPETNGNNSPSVLFVHVYYHFCLMRIFKPFLGVDFDDFDIAPREVCREAAQSVTELAKEYSGKSNTEPWPILIPYFLRAAELLLVDLGLPP